MRAEHLGLRDYIEIARRRWPLLLSVFVAVVAIAALYSALAAPKYRASAQVLIADSRVQSQLDLGASNAANVRNRDLQNEVEFAQSDRVVETAANELGFDPEVSVGAESDADGLRFTVIDGDPDRAATVANTYALAYIDQRLESVAEGFISATTIIQDRLAEIDAERAGLDPADAVAAAALDSASAQLRDQINNLQLVNQLAEVGVAQLNRQAKAPVQPFAPNWMRNLALGALLGLGLGAGLALLQETLTDTVRTRRDLATVAGVPVMGAIPATSTPKRRGPGSRKKMPVVTAVTGAFVEGFRSVRSSLSLLVADGQISVVAVTSANPSEGKSTTAMNLAVMMSQTGKRVLLIDGDLRNAALHTMLGVRNDQGLAEWITAGEEVDVVTENATGESMFSFIPAGRGAYEAAELLVNGRFAKLVTNLRSEYDLILIDTAPVLPLSDTQLMAPSCDAMLFVAKANTTSGQDVVDGFEQLSRSGAPVVGTVLTFAEDRADRYGNPYGAATASSAG